MPNYHDAVSLAQQVAHHDAQNLFNQFPRAIKTIIRTEVWKGCTDKNGEPFQTFQAFVEHRLWQGLELTLPRLIRYCEDDEEAVALIKGEVAELGYRGAPEGNKNASKENKVDNINFDSETKGGTKADYTLARLKRDAPELAKQVIDGEKSANAAAVEAGFRKRKIQVEPDPQAIQRMLDRHLPGWRLLNEKTGEAVSSEKEAT